MLSITNSSSAPKSIVELNSISPDIPAILGSITKISFTMFY